jgi:hypothetical protein
MAHEFLDSHDINPLHNQVGSEGMPKVMEKRKSVIPDFLTGVSKEFLTLAKV